MGATLHPEADDRAGQRVNGELAFERADGEEQTEEQWSPTQRPQHKDPDKRFGTATGRLDQVRGNGRRGDEKRQ